MRKSYLMVKPDERNSIELGSFVMHPLNIDELSELISFDCGDDDLNQFFNKDAVNYKINLLA